VYTFTKRVSLDEAEAKPRRAQGYSTVSHFNVIHVDCHLAAVRSVFIFVKYFNVVIISVNNKIVTPNSVKT